MLLTDVLAGAAEVLVTNAVPTANSVTKDLMMTSKERKTGKSVEGQILMRAFVLDGF